MNPASLYKSGFVAVMGRPNVGKSTLINGLLGQKVAAVSPRPQTTRRQQLGILTLENAQVIFVDTPGLHNPRHKLGEHLNREAAQALEHADLILFVVDLTQYPPHEEDRLLVSLLAEAPVHPRVILALNKIDLVDPLEISGRQAAYQELLPEAIPVLVSAVRGDHFEGLIDTLVLHLPKGDPFYPEDQVTDIYEREIAADLIREACLLHLRDEVPHAIAVRIDEFRERESGGAFVAATVIVERESQKGIVIGKAGSMLKQIGSTARQEIEAMSGRKIFLQINVKVRPNWRNDENELKRFGFKK